MKKIYKLEQETLVDIHNNIKISYTEMLSNIKINIIKKTDLFLEFDLIGVDCSIANALRRVLINEIPVYAIDKIVIHNNTSVLPDEFLAHRIGLIPITCLPGTDLLSYRLKVYNDENDVRTITSNDIEGDFLKPDIIIAKLAPRQCIDMEMTAECNIGKVHSKWSPVCPATYKLMPIIEIGDFYDDQALKLKNSFSDGVIEIVNENGKQKAVVVNPRLDSMSREVLRHKEFENSVFLGRKNDYFIFTIESVALDPIYLVNKALEIIINKLDNLDQDLQDYKNN